MIDTRTPFEVAIDAGSEFFDFRVSKTLLRGNQKNELTLKARCFVALFLRALNHPKGPKHWSYMRIADVMRTNEACVRAWLKRAAEETAAGPPMFTPDQVYRIIQAARSYRYQRGHPDISDIEKENVFKDGRWQTGKGPNNVTQLRPR